MSNVKKKNESSEMQTTTSPLRLVGSEANSLPQVRKDQEIAIARGLLTALKCKDDYTYGHSLRVARYSKVLGAELNFDEEQLFRLELAAIFHDIGKIGTPDEVLLKPGRLSVDEFEIMKKHPVESAEILKNFHFFHDLLPGVLHHHERVDGRGYPHGLKNEDIPLFARIIIIADTFDAMTSTRAYRNALSAETAIKEIEDCAGTQFDPALAKDFIRAIKNDLKRLDGKDKDLIIPTGNVIKYVA
jgi:putative nucleotidyltransferase with HDIG domain